LSLLVLALLAMLLEQPTVALLEATSLVEPMAIRRTRCENCTRFMDAVDAVALRVASAVMSKEPLMQPDKEDGATPVKLLNDEARATAIDVIMSRICHARSRWCDAELVRRQQAVEQHLVEHATLFSAVPSIRATDMCSRDCVYSRQLLHSAVHRIIEELRQPAVQPVVKQLQELWGAVVIVCFVGALLIVTLNARSGAAERQYDLYLALVARFRFRVGRKQPGRKAPSAMSPAVATPTSGVPNVRSPSAAT
jgi:hypothetical protein